MEEKKMEVLFDKTLKLNNVVSIILEGEEISNVSREGKMLENYIKGKSVQLVGPIVQHIYVNNTKQTGIPMLEVLRQTNRSIEVDKPYNFRKEVVIRNCIFGRYKGPRNKMDMIYQKLQIMAFERGIELSPESYTIILCNEVDNFCIDVFIQCVN